MYLSVSCCGQEQAPDGAAEGAAVENAAEQHAGEPLVAAEAAAAGIEAAVANGSDNPGHGIAAAEGGDAGHVPVAVSDNPGHGDNPGHAGARSATVVSDHGSLKGAYKVSRSRLRQVHQSQLLLTNNMIVLCEQPRLSQLLRHGGADKYYQGCAPRACRVACGRCPTLIALHTVIMR